MNSKYCAVPKCFNSSIKTPEKLFFTVPKNLKIRKKWITAIRRQDPIGPNSHGIYCCEDHFDMEHDMDNYVKHNLVGERLKLKKDIIPHKFACQNRLVEKPERPVITKLKVAKLKTKLLTITEDLTENVATTSHEIEQLIIVDPIAQAKKIDIDPLEDTAKDTINERTKYTKKHKKIQVNIKTKEDVPIQYEEIETLDPTYDMDSDDSVPSEQITDEVIIKHEPQIQAFTHDDYIIPNKISSTGSTNKKKLMRSIKRKPKRIISSKPNERLFGTKEYVDKKIQEVARMANNSIPKKDDCDTYGEYIASTLRKHNNKTQCLIKQAINNILFEQEMQRYENPNDSDILRSTLNSDTKFKN